MVTCSERLMVPRPPKPVSMELNLAPMVDVMMCLIIFFMLASAMVSAENRPVNLPWALAAKELEKHELGNRVVINIRPSAANAEVAEYVIVRLEPSGTGEMALVERVLGAADVEPYLKAAAARAAGAKEELRCVIRGDREVTYKDVEVVLRACGLAKIAKIVFSAQEGVEPAPAAAAGVSP